MNWPLVVQGDDGIRPAGPPDACFYCKSKIGEPHRRDCVVVTKRVLLRYSFEVEVDVPHDWEPGDIEFHRNESSWCADNAIGELEDARKSHGCLCGGFECEYVSLVDGTPQRKVEEPPE